MIVPNVEIADDDSKKVDVDDRNFEPVDDHLSVTTPENIAFQYQLAGPFQRLMSFALDLLFTQVAYWGLVIIVMLALSMLSIATGPGSSVLMAIAMFFVLVGAFMVTWFYGAYMETYYNGRTWGKMLCRQRALSVDGSSVSGRQALLRNFFRAIDIAPIFAFPIDSELEEAINFTFPTALIGLVAMCLNKDYRRIGDLIAGTMVVKEETKGIGRIAQFSDPRVAVLAELLPTGFVVDSGLAQALASYVERRPYLGPGRIDEIARRLSPILISKMNLPHDTNPDLLLCALYYKTFHSFSTVADGIDSGNDSLLKSTRIPMFSGTQNVYSPSELNRGQ